MDQGAHKIYVPLTKSHRLEHTNTYSLLVAQHHQTTDAIKMDNDRTTPPPPQPILLLVSHSRTNPLRHRPDLKYDLRTVPNAPKQIRDKYSGVNKRLREHMLGHGDFVSLLDRAEAEIRALMRKLEAGQPAQGTLPPGKGKPASRATGTAGRGRTKEEDEESDESEEDDDDDDDDDDEEDEEEEELDVEGRPSVRVGAFCVRGRHRSVAFVEELALREWPKQWEVRMVHRDVGRLRKDSTGWKGDRRNGGPGRGFLGDEDE